MIKKTYDVKKYDKKFLKEILSQMVEIRRFEEKTGQMYGLRKMGGFLHLYIGQEAVAVGSIAALDMKKDYILTTYRDHAHALACGMDANSIMAEMYGKSTGCSKGKGGSMHFFDKDKHMLGGNGIVGAHVPVGVGVAFKIKYKKEDGVVLIYFGDGAAHQGALAEAMNLARIWDLPAVFICENNQYGMGTDFKRVSAEEDFSKMGPAFGMEGKQIDGMDVLNVYEELKDSVAKARKGEPSYIEIKTYRYKGHSASDPAKYRTKEELQCYKDSDPIVGLKNAMIEAGLLTEAEYKKLDDKMKEKAQAAAEYADQSPEPEMHELYTDILVD